MSAIPSLFPALNPAPVLPGLKNAILPAMPTFQPPPGPAPVVPDYQPAPPPDAFQRHLAVLNQPRPQPPAMYGLGQSGGLAQMGLPAAPALGEQPRLPDRRRAPRLDPEDPETYAKLRPAVLKAAETSSGWDDFLGALGRILDVVDIPRMWVNQAIAAVLGIKGSSPDKALTGGQRVYGSDVMRHMGVESRWGQLLGGFVWDVVTDPLSWVAGIGKAAKAVGKVAVGGKTHTMLRPIAKEARKLIGGGKYGSAIKALSDVAGIPMHPATLTKLTAAAEAVGKGDDLARMLAKTARGAGETAIEWERRVRGLGTDVAGLLDDVAKAGAKGSPLRAKGQAALGELFSEVVEKGGLGRAGGMRLSTEPLRHFPLLGTGISWRGKQIVPGLKHILPAMGPEQGLRLAAPGALALSPRVAGGIAGALVGAGVAPEDHPFAGMLTGAALGALAGPKLGRWAVESGHIASQGRSIGQGRGILGAIKQDLAKKFGRGGSLALRRSKSIQQAWGRASEAASRADLKGAPLNAARELKAFRLRFNKLTGFVLSKEETEKVARLFTSARELADLRPDDMLDVMAGVMTDTAMGRLGGAEVREVLSAKLVPGAARDVMLGAPELSAGVRRFGVFPDPQGKNWVVIEAVKDADDAIKRAPNQTARYRRVASRNSADDAIEWAMAHGADRNGVEGHVMLEWDDNGRLVSPAAGGEPMPPGQDLGFRGEIPQQTARQAAPAVETPPVPEAAARQTAAGELVRPAEEAAVATSVDDAILSALENTTTDFRQPSGGLASLRDARMSLGMTKKEFDDAIIRMANEKKIILHKYAFPFGQSQETGWEYLVKDPGAEQWYGGAVLGDSPEARAYASRGSSAATQRPTLAPATGIPLGPNDEPLSRAGLFGEDVPGAPIGRKQRKLGLDMEDARIQKAAVGETQIGDDLARRAVALVARKGGPTTERELVEALMDEKGWQTLFRDASNPMPEAREAFLQASKGKSLFASGPPMPAKGMLFQLADGDVDPVLWENLHLDRTMDPAMQRLVNRAQARMTAMGAKELEAGALGAFMQSAKVGYIPHYPTVEEARKQESLLGAIKRGIRKKQTFQHMRRLRDQSIEELHESIRRSGGRTFSYRTNPLEYETIRQMEHSHAMGNAFMLEEIMDTVGEKLAKGKPVKDGWARLTGMKTGYFKPFEDRIVPRDVADYLRGVDRMWERPGAMARAFDQALGTMKGWMLIAPAYHIRNAISNLWLLMSGEAFGLSSVDDGYRALKAVRVGSAKKFGKALARTLNPDTGNPYTWKEVVDELDAMGVLKRTLFDEPLSGIVSDVLQGAKPKKAWKQALNPLEWSELNRRVGGYIEDGAKVSGVIERLRRGDTIQQAAARVQRFLFDYTDLTHFERTTMRRLFPFYSWAKNNFLLQMDLLLERPEITAILPKLKGNIETSLPPGEVVPSALRPSYVRKEAGTQLGGGLKPTYMNLPNILPISELKYATPGGAVRGAMDLLNPLIKQPVEHALNKDFFFDKPIQNYPGETTNVAGMELPPHIAHSITMIRPLSEVNRIAYGIRRGERPSSILGRVTGMRTFEGNLPREIAAYQRRQAETRGYMRAHAKIAIANGDLGKAEKIAATFEDNHMPEDATKVRIMLAEAQQDYQAAAAMAKQLAALQRERRQTQPSQTTVRELATAVSQR